MDDTVPGRTPRPPAPDGQTRYSGGGGGRDWSLTVPLVERADAARNRTLNRRGSVARSTRYLSRAAATFRGNGRSRPFTVV